MYIDYSILDDNKAQKQRSLLFKELNKCLMMRISNCSDNVVSAEKLASLTLYECAMSSLNDNFCKVGIYFNCKLDFVRFLDACMSHNICVDKCRLCSICMIFFGS